MEITQGQFQAYVDVQMSGVTNMWAVDLVCELSGLNPNQALYIMKHYGELKDKYKEAK